MIMAQNNEFEDDDDSALLVAAELDDDYRDEDYQDDDDDDDDDDDVPRVTLRMAGGVQGLVRGNNKQPSLCRIPDWVKQKFPGIAINALKYGYKGVQIAPQKDKKQTRRYCANVNLGKQNRPSGRRRHSGYHVGTFKTISEAACIAHLAMAHNLKSVTDVRNFLNLEEMPSWAHKEVATHQAVVHTSPYADGYQSLINGVSIGYWPTEKDAIAAGKLADKHGFKTRDQVQEYLAHQDKPPPSFPATFTDGADTAEIAGDTADARSDAEAERKHVIDIDDSDDDTSVFTAKKRKLSDRFSDLEECKKNGYITENEYHAKRAMLVALI